MNVVLQVRTKWTESGPGKDECDVDSSTWGKK